MHTYSLKSKKLLLLLTTFLISNLPLKAMREEGEKDTFSVQKFKTEFDRLAERNMSMLSSSMGKDIVVLLGKTGSGKSTTVNFLSNKALQSNQDEELELVNPADPTSMKIGSGGTSQTAIPQHTVIGDLVYYDIPGLQDTRGLCTELANAAIIKHLIESAKTSRLLFVIGQDEITASRGASFKELLKSAQDLFPDNKSALDSSLIIITKSVKRNSDDLISYLNGRIDEDLISTWTGSRNIFPISKTPQDDQRQKILDKVKDSTPARIYNVNIARIYNSNLRMELQGIFTKEFKDILSKALEKGNGDTSTIKAIEDLQHYFARPFIENNTNDKENSQLFKYFKPLSLETYKVQEDVHSVDVKTNQQSHQEVLKLKKESLEREEAKKREEEKRIAAEKDKKEADEKTKAAEQLRQNDQKTFNASIAQASAATAQAAANYQQQMKLMQETQARDQAEHNRQIAAQIAAAENRRIQDLQASATAQLRLEQQHQNQIATLTQQLITSQREIDTRKNQDRYNMLEKQVASETEKRIKAENEKNQALIREKAALDKAAKPPKQPSLRSSRRAAAAAVKK